MLKGATGTQRERETKNKSREDLHGGGVTDSDSETQVGLSAWGTGAGRHFT